MNEMAQHRRVTTNRTMRASWMRMAMWIGVLISISACRPVRGEQEADTSMLWEVPSAVQLLPVAYDEARGYYAHPALIKIDIGLSPGNVVSSFDYISEDNPDVVLLVSIEQNDGLEITSREFQVPSRSRMDEIIRPSDWKLDSIEVAELAYDDGGELFLQQNPGQEKLLIQLTDISGSAKDRMGVEWGSVAWRVSFYQLPSPSLDYYFDPIEGTLIGTIRTPAQ